MSWTWIFLPFVGGLIGWVTNFVAIRMLFRPKRPKRIGGLVFQGVLPRRQKELADVIAKTVERDLLPLNELLDSLNIEAYNRRIVGEIVSHVHERIDAQIPDIFPPKMKELIATFAGAVVEREAPRLVDGLIDNVKQTLVTDIRVGEFVRAKVESFDVAELEDIAIRVARTELRTVEVLGAVLGFFIGLIQASLVHFIS